MYTVLYIKHIAVQCWGVHGLVECKEIYWVISVLCGGNISTDNLSHSEVRVELYSVYRRLQVSPILTVLYCTVIYY